MAKGGGWYNGFDWNARNAKLAALKRYSLAGVSGARSARWLCPRPEKSGGPERGGALSGGRKARRVADASPAEAVSIHVWWGVGCLAIDGALQSVAAGEDRATAAGPLCCGSSDNGPSEYRLTNLSPGRMLTLRVPPDSGRFATTQDKNHEGGSQWP